MKRRILGALLLFSTLSEVAAAVFLGNLPGSNDGYTGQIGSHPFGGSRQAISFSIPSGTNYELTSATVRLWLALSSVNPLIGIHADASGDPGAVISTLNSPPLTDGPAPFVFTAPSPITLSAGATYWLVADHPNSSPPSPFLWTGTDPPITPAGIGIFNWMKFSIDEGATWHISGSIASFQIDATPAIPEPSRIALLFAGLLCCSIFRSRTSLLS